MFPWWDRSHQALRLNVPASEIAIGVPVYLKPDLQYTSRLTHSP
ncbi:hypothetical protein [[Phormidium] sp. LEGE 05292]|nr:hypothetical protein [Phormidium sp. LEGE 05292]